MKPQLTWGKYKKETKTHKQPVMLGAPVSMLGEWETSESWEWLMNRRTTRPPKLQFYNHKNKTDNEKKRVTIKFSFQLIR